MARKTETGKWQGIVRKKGHKTRTKVFSKKTLAERWERQTLDEIEKQIITPVADRILVTELVEKYEREFMAERGRRDPEMYHLQVIKNKLGEIVISQLTATMIIDYVKDRLKTVTSGTIRKEIGKFSVIIDTAIALGEIDLPANPIHTAKSIMQKHKILKPGNKRDRRFTDEELTALYKTKHGRLFEFAVETAMRRSEILNMKPHHIKGNTLHIPHTKTGVARTIPLSKRALELLTGWEKWGILPEGLSKAFRRACQQLDIEGARFHDLRHEATSRLFEKGWHIPQVAAVTGHADWESLKIYTNLKASDLADKLHEEERPKLYAVK